MCKKQVCSECGRIFRLKCFVFNPIKNKKICRQCHRRIGANKFYTPEINGAKKKHNWNSYNLNWDERQALFKELVQKGMDVDKAKERVNNRCRYIQWFQWRQRIQEKDGGNKEVMDNLLRGLGQK